MMERGVQQEGGGNKCGLYYYYGLVARADGQRRCLIFCNQTSNKEKACVPCLPACLAEVSGRN